MKKSFKKNIIILSFSFLFLFLSFSFVNAELYNPLKTTDPVVFIERIAEWIADIVIYASVLMGLVASFWFITSGGSTEAVKKGKDALKWTVIGLVVVIAANPILDIIRTQVGTGQDIKSTLDAVVGYLQIIGGPITILAYLWGSALYTTGIKKNIEKAHNVFLWASIGAAVILVASSIEAFIRAFIS